MTRTQQQRRDENGGHVLRRRVSDHHASVPDFTLGDMTWQCWIATDGEHNWYEWRSVEGDMAAWREGNRWRARNGERTSQHTYDRLIDAMWAAQHDRERRAAA